MKIQLPFKNQDFPITQLFGAKFMYRGSIVSHKGVDWAMPKFTELRAPFDGEIYRTEKIRDYGYGKTIYIRTKDDSGRVIQALLAHCSEILHEQGTKVKAGNIIAHSGNSGFWRGKNGYHLHFGLKISGKYVDPLPYLKIESEKETLFDNKEDQSKLRSYHGNYEVVKGDTLWDISVKFYGNGGHHMDIFNVNQDILENPNKIYPKQILRIPFLVDKGV